VPPDDETLPALLTMGFPAAANANACGEFATLFGELAKVEIGVRIAESYERLAAMLNDGSLDLAWLSPLPYIALSAAGVVAPLVYSDRVAKHYCSAIVVPVTSRAIRLSDLAGTRAAWVDRHSAAGFVVPRIQLANAGVDPRTALSKETFFGSHDAVVRAVASGEADFGATYAHRDKDGRAHGLWSADPELTARVRVIATFGKIPPDLVAARTALDLRLRATLTRALRSMNTSANALLREVFDVDRFRLLDAETYESLQTIAREARDAGLLGADADQTAPRPALS
jgi:phosphate/phosphite/phosphonate ABC transporter binding protein